MTEAEGRCLLPNINAYDAIASAGIIMHRTHATCTDNAEAGENQHCLQDGGCVSQQMTHVIYKKHQTVRANSNSNRPGSERREVRQIGRGDLLLLLELVQLLDGSCYPFGSVVAVKPEGIARLPVLEVRKPDGSEMQHETSPSVVVLM